MTFRVGFLLDSGFFCTFLLTSVVPCRMVFVQLASVTQPCVFTFSLFYSG